jgi:hypothetical protein
MARCSLCGQGVNSTYIREGSNGLIRKIGYHCIKCDSYYDLTSEKLIQLIQKLYTVILIEKNKILAPFGKIKSLGRDLDPGPLPYQGNALPG